MTKVFIGGSRRVSRLNADVRRRIDRIVEKRIGVLIGDANGADKAVQQYLKSGGYDRVEVFYAGGECRNNIGSWPLRAVPTGRRKKDFEYYATKDRLMADEASLGFMIWDGKSLGTLLNMLRLISQRKKVVVYNFPVGEFSELKNQADWEAFVSDCSSDLRARVEREAEMDKRSASSARQASLL